MIKNPQDDLLKVSKLYSFYELHPVDNNAQFLDLQPRGDWENAGGMEEQKNLGQKWSQKQQLTTVHNKEYIFSYVYCLTTYEYLISKVNSLNKKLRSFPLHEENNKKEV